MIELPPSMWDVRYVGALHPGTATDLSKGANCQLFVYAVLALNGLVVPPLRSRELWADTSKTSVVEAGEALDLVLFNRTADPYGAHVGVVADHDQVLHLCQEVGRPAVWSFADFAARPRYAYRIGFKRVRRGS